MLFIHDHTFIVDGDKHYTTGSLNQSVMDRYKGWFGSLSVFATMRVATSKDAAFMKQGNLVKGVDFQLVPKKNSVSHIIKCSGLIEQAVIKSDCVVIRMSIFGALGAYYARKHHVPYLVEMVACPWDSLWNHSFKGKLLAPIMTVITKNVCKRAPYVLYVTNEFLQKRYPSSGITIGCSDVELKKLDQEVLSKRIEKLKQYDKNDVLKLVTVANVNVRYKGQELVIRALSELEKNGLHCEYYLIGGGNPEYLSGVAKECGVEEKVHIIGPKPHDEIFDILDQMDIYVQPSLQEGLPRAVIEAMSRGCPVIGSTTGGIPELIASECVFKRKSKSSFIAVMSKIDKSFLLRNAKLNFEKAEEYEKDYLDEKRSEFYENFAQKVQMKYK